MHLKLIIFNLKAILEKKIGELIISKKFNEDSMASQVLLIFLLSQCFSFFYFKFKHPKHALINIS